ncbi:hypothetical protein [Noviherbaspirillum denitrificans]|uniref:hypothetical protein n=1 Tax=Noviherbaspirillum denitrificans TaxID=1968433 RepID=UPI00148275E6|nr:hypothetical protein [Noviherbaspirillum denitrificans]
MPIYLLLSLNRFDYPHGIWVQVTPVLCIFVTTMAKAMEDLFQRLPGAATIDEKVKEIT